MKRFLVLALLSSLAVFTQVSADEQGSKAVSDEQFVQKATASGMAEVELGKLGVQQAMSEDVKKFSQQMVDDHTKANKELSSLAATKKFTAATSVEKAHQDAHDKLSKLKGADFDRAFMDQMVKDHEEAVALFTAKSQDAKDADLKTFATNTLPKLKEHLKMARDLAGKRGSDKDK